MKLLIGGLIGLLAHGCAQKGMPDGGPPDTTAPTIVQATPEAGAVRVARDAAIEIEFSEPIDKEKLAANLYISPRRTGPLKQEWSGQTVRLTWPDSLRADVTYRVTIGGKLVDRHNNPLAEAHTFAFATGAVIDSGRIAGDVWDGTKPASAVDVIAFGLDEHGDWDPAGPGFQTQTNADGHFDLPYLRSQRFRVLAVVDKNRNNRPDPGETMAIAARDLDAVAAGMQPALRLFMHVYDTTIFTFAKCSVAPDGSVLLGLTHSADTSRWQGSRLVARDTATGEKIPLATIRPLPPNFTVLPAVGALQPGRAYEITLADTAESKDSGIINVAGRELAFGSCVVVYAPPVDTVGPRVQWTVFPEYGRVLRPGAGAEFGFSEVIDTSKIATALRAFDTTGAEIAGDVIVGDLRRILFRPQATWPETEVIMTLDSMALLDRAGNPAPAQPFSWSFVPLTDVSMGNVSCRVEQDRPDAAEAPLVVWSVSARGGQRVEWRVPDPHSVQLALPTGDWILGAYLDANGDGRYSYGSIDPYAPAEEQTIVTDTVRVRARFTVEDIVIRF